MKELVSCICSKKKNPILPQNTKFTVGFIYLGTIQPSDSLARSLTVTKSRGELVRDHYHGNTESLKNRNRKQKLVGFLHKAPYPSRAVGAKSFQKMTKN